MGTSTPFAAVFVFGLTKTRRVGQAADMPTRTKPHSAIAILWMMIAAFCMASFSPRAAAQTAAPAKAMSPELRSAALEFAKYWEDALSGTFRRMGESGVADPRSLFPKESIPEIQAKCDNFIHLAGERLDLQVAAHLLGSAYTYASENAPLQKKDRHPPKDPELAKLLGEPANGITEGYLIKNILAALARFRQSAGFPSNTEEEVKAMYDIDFSWDVKLPPARPVKEAAFVYEVVITVKEDGTILLYGKAVSLAELSKSLTMLKKKKAGSEVTVALDTDRAVKYAKVKEVMIAIEKAKIRNVSFLIHVAE